MNNQFYSNNWITKVLQLSIWYIKILLIISIWLWFKGVIHFLSCKKCKKFYIGSTTDTFRRRFNKAWRTRYDFCRPIFSGRALDKNRRTQRTRDSHQIKMAVPAWVRNYSKWLHMSTKDRCYLLFCLFCEEGEDVRQLGNDMFGQKPGYNGDRNLGSLCAFWP